MNCERGTLSGNNWTIYNKNCLDITKADIPNESIDCVVTSPPYWDCRAYGGNPKKDGNVAKWLYSTSGERIEGEIGNGSSKEEYIKNIGKVFEMCYRLLKNEKFMFINIGNKRSKFEFIDLSHGIIQQAKKAGFVHRDTIIWIKRNPSPPGRHKEYYLANAWEYVLVFTKGKPRKIYYRNYMKIKSHFTCKKCGEENFTEKDINPNYFYSNIGCFGRKRTPTKYHPALFPIEVPTFCLRITTKKGDTIFDPFVGSGTTLIAGLEQNLNVIGCELVPQIYENLVKEMKNIDYI